MIRTTRNLSISKKDYDEYDGMRRTESQKMFQSDDDLTMPKFIRMVMNDWKINHPPEVQP